ncbi:MAG TPA: bacteriohopanetetrol glucosamine biosynthesis glycosyltransferase HpnI [Magnetospirillaceae bacterium]|nr:bacteriohopanetetrol glucosamine biosynthesis glycosyltransferase HpnI [Magnetospirillaceae bacterium]
MSLIADVFGILALFGVVQSLFGWFAVFRFARLPAAAPNDRPGITVLRPMCGAEPMLEEALVSCFSQDYPDYQIVFGLQDPKDPALAVLERVRKRFPKRDVTVVIDGTPHGQNRKVSNLINMLPAAKHEILVISDSDIHAAPNYLDTLLGELQKPGTGMVTSLYAGLPPAGAGLFERLGAMQINHSFLPGVLMSRMMGRQDCLGSTVMMTKDVLARTGGLHSLSDLLAEDNHLGRKVRELGLEIRLSFAVAAATVPENTLQDLWQHETRWTRTIRGLAPYALVASALQYPLFWALMSVLMSGFEGWSLFILLFCWLARALAGGAIEATLNPRLHEQVRPAALWLYPLRDLLSVSEIVATYGIDNVVWRGHKLYANGGLRP